MPLQVADTGAETMPVCCLRLAASLRVAVTSQLAAWAHAHVPASRLAKPLLYLSTTGTGSVPHTQPHTHTHTHTHTHRVHTLSLRFVIPVLINHTGAEAGATPVTATVGFGGIDRTGPRWLALRSLAASLQGFVAAGGAGAAATAQAAAAEGTSAVSAEDAEAEAVLGAVARLAAAALRQEGACALCRMAMPSSAFSTRPASYFLITHAWNPLPPPRALCAHNPCRSFPRIPSRPLWIRLHFLNNHERSPFRPAAP